MRIPGSLTRLGLGLTLAFALIAGATGPSPAEEPHRRALLVGVSNYPKETVGDLQLAGPKNDVALMIDTVARLGFADRDVTVLADALDQTTSPRKADGAPTRAAILASLADLTAKSRPGDFVLLYFSGHGSQQPDPDPAKRPVPKPDGLEEIFLPIDIGPWDDAVGSVKNALVDHELGRAVTAIRARGAEVWVVVDACHSGTMTRAGGDGTVKQIPPRTLAIPQTALDRARRAAAERAPIGRTRGGARDATPSGHGWGFDGGMSRSPAPAEAVTPGGYVAFFAAYPDQLALQKALPRGYGVGERRPHGVLTFYLAQALRSGRVATFRDVAHRVMVGYEQFGQAPTPMFEGDLSAPVPGGSAEDVLRWPVKTDGARLALAAGAVDGVTRGAVVALSTVDEPGTIRAFARVETAGAARAELLPIERDGKVLDPALARDTLLATLVEKGADFAFRIARPETPKPDAAPIGAALEALAGAHVAGIEAVGPKDAADLRLFVENGRIWLVTDDTDLVTSGRNQTPSIALAPGITAADARALLEKPLAALAKARNLLRVAGLLGEGPAATVRFEGFVAPDGGRAEPTAATPDDRPCPPWARDHLPDDARPLGPAEMPALAHCDTVWFRLTNTGAAPVDVTPLYVDGAGGVSYMGPPEGLRLDPDGVPRLVPLRIVTWSRKTHAPLPVGLEHLLFVMVEVEGREALPADFRHLAQPAPTTVAMRGAAAPSPWRGILEAAAFGTATRSASAPAGSGKAGIAAFSWRVVAPE